MSSKEEKLPLWSALILFQLRQSFTKTQTSSANWKKRINAKTKAVANGPNSRWCCDPR